MFQEDLSKADITIQEVQNIWSARRSRMALRRAYFEPLWRAGINRFFEGIISQSAGGNKPLYNSLYEQYDTTMFSREGLRFNQLKYPLSHALTMRAMANELPNLPNINFVAIGSNDPTRPTAFRHLFDQVLYEMDADQEDFEILLDKNIQGSSIVLVTTEQYKVNVKDPVYDPKTGEYTYEEKSKTIRQCLYKKLDLRHVFIDEHCTKTSLKDCNYASVDEYFAPEAAKAFFANADIYDQAQVDMALRSPVQKQESEVYEQIYDTKDVDFARATYCWDKIHDVYHILLNGLLINKKDSPIPRIAGRRGKEIPLAMAVKYKIPNAPYGYADPHITQAFNSIKNLIRVMILEITQKSAKPTLAVDPLSAFDESGFEWGMDFIRVSPKDLQEIKVNPDLNMLYELDKTTDNDIIRATGINIDDTSNSDADETARKTIIRRESQNAITEVGMNYMASSFLTRLYTLLKDDVKLHYGAMLKGGQKVQVKTKDVKLKRVNGGFDSETVSGFRYFDLKEEDIDFDMELDLELGNIASSRELDKALQKEGIDSALQMPNGFSPDGLAKWIAEINEMPDYVLAKPVDPTADGDPEAMAKEGLDPSLLPDSAQIQAQQQQMQQQDPNNPQNVQPQVDPQAAQGSQPIPASA